MKFRRTYALWGAMGVLAAVPATALAAGTKVSVRVEGLNKTLLAAKAVRTGPGSITKGGTPSGTCPASSAAGALNAATKGAWGGSFDKSFNELVLVSILGESWPFSGPGAQTNYYWGLWVDNHYASAGMCLISLHRGDQILFAVDSVKHHEHPLGISAPRTDRVGRPFKVKVVWYTDAGKARPLKGVRIDGVTTNRRGIARITPKHAGRLRLKASQKGYIRSAARWVRVLR